ncbi:cation:proton antiporter [Demequina mangrovi]|uniref:Sodium/proton antiporter, CPA1 family n=1 Tax=Demequina mangrovi TaxID=1043493 RepID=A0A1H6ZBS4_9MICO|nr:sodium:proton antiporter [Demequina mangrovi]SEJ50778.1 sodium/proton antiporter, CPA1 family [Demequina mangrovi]
MGIDEVLLIGVVAVIAIVAVHSIAPRVGVAAPLLLVSLGVAVSFIPGMPEIEVESEFILLGIIPPLLYSAAVNLPSTEFRRDFRSISSLSIVLVLLSSALMGLFFMAMIPGIGFALGAALGAVVSPTDAVAVQIIRKMGVSPRIVTVLEAESMFNDATALVTMRTAVAAAGASMGLAQATWDFASAVVIAVIIGLVTGELNVRLRRWVPGAANSTAISFVAPFAAAVPAELLGASGLVAAVVAGLVAGYRAPLYLRPADRISERTNWRTAELLLEGVVFLLLGLELLTLVEDVEETHGSVWFALWLGLAALGLVLLIRIAYVAPLVLAAGRRARRVRARHEHVEGLAAEAEAHPDPAHREAVARRVEQHSAYADYLEQRPLGWREGGVLVWAGMRGAITVAAAQTLPSDTPLRSTMVLIAFVVAVGSLMSQGATLPWVTQRLGIAGESVHDERERAELRDLLAGVADTVLADAEQPEARGASYPPEVVDAVRRAMAHARAEDEETVHHGERFYDLRLAIIDAQRARLLEARAVGTFGSEALGDALGILDAEQISLQLRADHPEGDD